MGEYKLLNRGQAEGLAYFFKNYAMHEATMHEIQIATTVHQDKDEDNMPYEELVIRIPFTQKEV